jgi:hypothetical protein
MLWRNKPVYLLLALLLMRARQKPTRVEHLGAPPGACTIKHYGFVVYGKWTDFVVSWCLLSWTNMPAWTNTLAYYGVQRLLIRNVL